MRESEAGWRTGSPAGWQLGACRNGVACTGRFGAEWFELIFGDSPVNPASDLVSELVGSLLGHLKVCLIVLIHQLAPLVVSTISESLKQGVSAGDPDAMATADEGCFSIHQFYLRYEWVAHQALLGSSHLEEDSCLILRRARVPL